MEKKTTALGTVNNEVDFCKVYDMGTKEQIERILLANRISYSCRFEKQGFFSKLFGVGEKALCTFRIHDEEVPRAKRLVASVLGNKNKRKGDKEIMERKNAWKGYDEAKSAKVDALAKD